VAGNEGDHSCQCDFSAIHRAGLSADSRTLIYKGKISPTRSDLFVTVCIIGMSLFFVGKLRPQDVTGNLLALASGFCFACYFLLLRHSTSRSVNRASSVIYGNLLLVLVAAPVGLRAVPQMNMHDALSVLYLGVVQIGLAYTLFTVADWPAVFALWTRALSDMSNRFLIQSGCIWYLASGQVRGR